jgi:hypothetical protein
MSGLFGYSAKAAPVIAPGAVEAVKPPYDISKGLIGGLFAQRQAQFQAQQAAAARQAMLNQADGLGMSPQERFALQYAPDDTFKAMAERFKPQQVTGGNTLVNGPQGAPFMAPKLVEDQGIYGTQGADGYQQTGARAPSIAERQTQFKNAADIDAEIQRLMIAKGQLAVSQGQLGINRDAYNARLRGVGGFGTPGVGGGSLGGGDVPAGAGWEVQ